MYLSSAPGLTDGHPALPRADSEQTPHGKRCHPIAGQLKMLGCSFLKPSNMLEGLGMRQT